MSNSGTGSNGAKAVHPFVEKARNAVLRGHNISLHARRPEKTGARRESRPAAVSWQAIAEGALEYSDVDVVFLDFTGNKDRSAKLAALAESNSRTFRSSLVEPFGIWRGDWLAVFNKLLVFFKQAEPWFPEFDLGKTYVAIQKAIALEMCRPPLGPPRSDAELLKRLKDEELLACEGLSAFRRHHRLLGDAIHRMRGAAGVFRDAETNLNGKWAWEDAGVAYVGLEDDDPMFRDTLGAALVLSLAERLEELHRQGRSCVVFFDANPDDARISKMEPLFGAAFAFGSAVVLLPEATEHLFHFTRIHLPSLNVAEEAEGFARAIDGH